MRKLLRLFAAVLVSMGVTGGMAAAATGSIENTGQGSDNDIVWESESEVYLDNRTDVEFDVDLDQDADSGDARMSANTTGGDAETGDATNESEIEAALTIDNSGSSSDALTCGCVNGGDHEASIDTTGQSSDNRVHFKNESSVRVDNDTDVDVDVDVDQNASSGDAKVWGNTTGGDASTGSATNTSSVVFSLSVTN